LDFRKIIKINLLVILIGVYGCSSSGLVETRVNDSIGKARANENQINLITYNIQDVFGKGKEKLDALTNYFNKEDYDFVLLQELFNEGTREYVLSEIDTEKYRYIIPRIDYDSFPEFLFNDAGLFYMSRFPTIDLSRIEFENGIENKGNVIHKLLKKEISFSTDFLANKSIAGSLFQINDSTKLFLCSTHVQAIGSKHQKGYQLRQIRKFIEQAVHKFLSSNIVESSENLAVILAGDFNSDAYNEQKLEMFQTYLGNPRDIHSEFNIDKEEYTFKLRFLNRQLRFDYILAYDYLLNVPLKKVEVLEINATDIHDKNGESISDHLALKAKLILE
jgi:endonuclease/exonuclease/phosphatase family metal-dependent hydrolase